MSVCTSEVMTNHHHDLQSHPTSAFSGLLHTWRERYSRRQELTRLTDEDFHDVGASRSDFAFEANKPFWRA